MSQTTPGFDERFELFRRMLLIRKVEGRIKSQYHLREMRSPPHLYTGHEAIAAGVCVALTQKDLVFPYYRSHGWYLAKGGDLRAMVAELHGRTTGCSRGWGGSMHLIDLDKGVAGSSAIVGGTLSHAAGAALTFRMRKQDRVAVVSFGDGAVEEGVFYETLNFAALRSLPVLFVCENNLYATNTHIRDRQASPEIYRQAERFGMAGVRANGNDVVEVNRVAQEAVARARAGKGPTLLEMLTYRQFEHCGVFEDDQLGYRTLEEVQSWRARDPLQLGRDLVSAEVAAKLEADIDQQLDDAFAYARSSPWPTGLTQDASPPAPAASQTKESR